MIGSDCPRERSCRPGKYVPLAFWVSGVHVSLERNRSVLSLRVVRGSVAHVSPVFQ